MYATLEMDGMAYKTFGEVIRSNPPYELEFAARIRQTEVFTGTNFQKMVKKLERMAKNQKNKDYLDQVYYALGNLYMSQEDTAQAIKSYELGVEKSTQNGLDKAMCQIKLGDIYFEKRDYIKAQPNFSGALAGIQKEYKDYERVSKLSAVLDELVIHAEAVHLQDSLQTLAKMPEKERLAVIDKIIEQVIEEEKRAQEEAEKEAFLAEQAAKGTGIDRPGTEAPTVTIPTAGGENTFYFYNPQAVAQGKTQFQRKWGRRPLEDDWRRRKKTLTTFQDPSEMDENGDRTMEGDSASIASGDSASIGSDDPKSREYYLQQLPMTPEDVAASNIIIEDGLYNMAMIYKDKLEDLPLAIQAFEDLEKRFPDNQHLLDSYYQIYLMALRLKDTDLAAEYLQKMKDKFPTSDYTIAVSDPNYEYNIRMMDVVQDSIYEETYELYLAEDTSAVRRNYRSVSEKYPLAKLLPKFMFLDALTYVQAGDPEGFKQALKALLDKYPSEDVSELAGEMLKGVLRGRQMVQGGVTGMTWNLRFGTGEDGSLSAADSARVFKADKNVPYRMVMIYPTGTIDRNQLLFSVAAYNFANFMVKQLDMTFEEAGMMSVFVLSGFYNFDEVWHYYKMIYGEEGYASALDRNIAILPISDENYETLMHGKTLDEYMAFFDQNFHDIAPIPEKEEQPILSAPKPEKDKGLTLEDIEEIRRLQAEAEEAEKEKARQAFAEEQAAEKAELEKNAEERAILETQQKATEEALLKAKKEREKQQEAERKAKLKKAEEERKAKLKAREELRKEKERAYKEKIKQREKELKEKERAYKKKLKEREKARKAELKAKERARKERMKNR